MDNFTLVGLGHVEYIEGGDYPFSDDANAGRIKVRVDTDGNKDTSELPYAFPLMPKTFHVLPKVGEGVLVVTGQIGNANSQRYYIGPIISQPQFNTKCEFDNGRGDLILSPAEKLTHIIGLHGEALVVVPHAGSQDKVPHPRAVEPCLVEAVAGDVQDCVFRLLQRKGPAQHGSGLALRLLVGKLRIDPFGLPVGRHAIANQAHIRNSPSAILR